MPVDNGKRWPNNAWRTNRRRPTAARRHWTQVRSVSSIRHPRLAGGLPPALPAASSSLRRFARDGLYRVIRTPRARRRSPAGGRGSYARMSREALCFASRRIRRPRRGPPTASEPADRLPASLLGLHAYDGGFATPRVLGKRTAWPQTSSVAVLQRALPGEPSRPLWGRASRFAGRRSDDSAARARSAILGQLAPGCAGTPGRFRRLAAHHRSHLRTLAVTACFAARWWSSPSGRSSTSATIYVGVGSLRRFEHLTGGWSVALPLSSLNYLLRFWKWELCLRLLKLRSRRHRRSRRRLPADPRDRCRSTSPV